jgi:integrase/recombinase XerD
MLLFAYSSGLRVKLVRLRLVDFDLERQTLHVRQGKGRKDRVTVLSEHAYAAVVEYVQMHKPGYWLFGGAKPREPLDRANGAESIRAR